MSEITKSLQNVAHLGANQTGFGNYPPPTSWEPPHNHGKVAKGGPRAKIRVKEKQRTKEKEKVRDGKEKVRSEGALDQRLRVSAMVP